jgi:hypothetical protein
MERREFLKLSSILTAGFLASKVPGYGQLSSDKVFIFTINDELGNPKIIASRYGITNLKSNNWKYGNCDRDSFKYLETVNDISRVPERKKFWFDHYGIKIKNNRQIGFSPGSVKGGDNAVKTNKKMGNLKITSAAAGKKNGPKTIQKCRQVYIENLKDPVKGPQLRRSHSDRMKGLKKDPEFNRRTREAHANSPAKKKSELENIKLATIGSVNSPNRFVKQRWICPDGHETHGPGRFPYCKNRGLDVTKCVLKPINSDGVELTPLKRPNSTNPTRSAEQFNEVLTKSK